jgi:hypothetical protein
MATRLPPWPRGGADEAAFRPFISRLSEGRNELFVMSSSLSFMQGKAANEIWHSPLPSERQENPAFQPDYAQYQVIL